MEGCRWRLRGCTLEIRGGGGGEFEIEGVEVEGM